MGIRTWQVTWGIGIGFGIIEIGLDLDLGFSNIKKKIVHIHIFIFMETCRMQWKILASQLEIVSEQETSCKQVPYVNMFQFKVSSNMKYL